MQLVDYQKKMVELKASDLFVTAGMPVAAKVNGELLPIADKALSDIDSLSLVLSAMNEKQQHEFNTTKECNFAIANDAGRFRVSAFWQRDQAGMVMRRIVTTIPNVDDLRLCRSSERIYSVQQKVTV
ncbi:twitching motility protein PilT [Alishewanella longhuensis]